MIDIFPGLMNGNEVEILKGVKPDDFVIIAPPADLVGRVSVDGVM